VLACGQADPEVDHGGAPTGVGYSTVASPLGDVVEQLAGKPGMIMTTVDTESVTRARNTLPVLANRRL
jgi:predicted amidohydrolase